MEASARTRFDPVGLALESPTGGFEHLPVRAGAMHYFQHDPAAWRAGLRALAGAGYTLVDTYVPWAVHETAAGSFDWSGRRDLSRFLGEAADAGLRVLLRPGPHINAELTHFGLPARVLRDPALQALTSRDTPAFLPAPPQMFPVPSYAAQGFQREARAWLAEVGRVAAPSLYPDGPIVAVQVDNENQAFFRLGAYDLDYHPDALAWWHESYPGQEPPRAWDPTDAERCVRWVQFKERYVVRSLAWVKAALDDAGFATIATFANQPPSDPRLLPHADLERAVQGPVGFDFYQRAKDQRLTRRRALHLAGSTHHLPIAPEVGVGGPLWLPPMALEDQQQTILQLLAAGVHAQTHYMAVDRDRWYGGAFLLRDGRARPTAFAGWLTTLQQTLQERDAARLQRHAPLAIIVSRADARFALASSVIDPLPPILADFFDCGPGGFTELGTDAEAIATGRWLATVEEALARAQIGYDLVDESAGVEAFARYRAVILPTTRRVDRATWRALRECAGRNTTVVIGPGAPTVDELDRPLGDDLAPPRGAGFLRAESLTDLDGLAGDLCGLAGELPELFLCTNDAPVEVTPLHAPDGATRLLCVSNRSDRAVVAHLAIDEHVLGDPFTGQRLVWPPTLEQATASAASDPGDEPEDGSVAVPLAPYQVRLFTVD